MTTQKAICANCIFNKGVHDRIYLLLRGIVPHYSMTYNYTCTLNGELDIVTGCMKYEDCEHERKSVHGTCGAEGKNFRSAQETITYLTDQIREKERETERKHRGELIEALQPTRYEAPSQMKEGWFDRLMRVLFG